MLTSYYEQLCSFKEHDVCGINVRVDLLQELASRRGTGFLSQTLKVFAIRCCVSGLTHLGQTQLSLEGGCLSTHPCLVTRNNLPQPKRWTGSSLLVSSPPAQYLWTARGASYLQKFPAQIFAFVEIDEVKPTSINRNFHVEEVRRTSYGAFGYGFMCRT